MRSLVKCSSMAIGLAALPLWAHAQTTGAASAADIAALKQAVGDAKMSADNSWMLVSAALVLMMTGPGLALFYSGLVRKKNVLGTMMQSFAMMAIISVTWALASYSLAFDSGTSFIGGLHHLFLRGVGAAPDPAYAPTFPAADLHDLPDDVRYHHAGADHGRICRTHEIQRHGRCSLCCGPLWSTIRWPIWCGGKAAS